MIAPDPPGTVLSAKEEGSNVNLTISGGYPLLAYDKDGDMFVANGADGKDERPIAKSDDVEEQPAWNKNGTLIAYRRGPGRSRRAASSSSTRTTRSRRGR